MKQLLDEPPPPVSASCPVCSLSAERLQVSEVLLYVCTCRWDECTAAQLRFIRPAA